MLLNLSNHPFSSWSAEQIEAAHSYGRIVDMPFPNIDPKASADLVLILAERFLVEIRKIDPNAIHVMGEMTFTFALVRLLQKVGYLCLAATSERMVSEYDGKKIITFQFVQFRPYNLL